MDSDDDDDDVLYIFFQMLHTQGRKEINLRPIRPQMRHQRRLKGTQKKGAHGGKVCLRCVRLQLSYETIRESTAVNEGTGATVERHITIPRALRSIGGCVKTKLRQLCVQGAFI